MINIPFCTERVGYFQRYVFNRLVENHRRQIEIVLQMVEWGWAKLISQSEYNNFLYLEWVEFRNWGELPVGWGSDS